MSEAATGGGTAEGRGRALPGTLAWGVGLAALVAGTVLVARLERTAVTTGVLLWVVALCALAVAVGQVRYGPEVEGRLDLSTRLGLGGLGGVLGGLAYMASMWLLETLGISSLLGAGVVGHYSLEAWGARAGSGLVWGVLLGIVYPWMPGTTAVARGAWFSLAPALWMLLWVYPEQHFGLFGFRIGALAFVFVILYHLVWGVVAGLTLRWGETTGEGPVSRLLGAG